MDWDKRLCVLSEVETEIRQLVPYFRDGYGNVAGRILSENHSDSVGKLEGFGSDLLCEKISQFNIRWIAPVALRYSQEAIDYAFPINNLLVDLGAFTEKLAEFLVCRVLPRRKYLFRRSLADRGEPLSSQRYPA